VTARALAQILPGQIPTDLVVIGVLGLFALVMIGYSIKMIFGRPKAAPQATPTPIASPVPPSGAELHDSQKPGAIKVVIKAPADASPSPGRSGESGRAEPPSKPEPRSDMARADAAADPAIERERLKAEFARSAEIAAQERKSGGDRSRGASPGATTGALRGAKLPDATPQPARSERTARTERYGRGADRGNSEKVDMRFDRGAATERIDARGERSGTSQPIDLRFERDRRMAQSGAIQDEPFYDKFKEKRIADELQEQNTELTNLLTMLPGLIKRLTETTKKRELAPLLADTIMRLCMPPPEKVMVFFLAKNKEELILAARAGYEDPVDVHSVMKMPKHFGRVGYAVRHQLTMDVKDFERDGIEDDPPHGQTWHVEIASPLIYNRELLGAISVEGFSMYNKNAKRLVGIAGNLGALAISLAEKTAQIQHQANSDALTGLYNKRYFFEKLEVEVEKAREAGRPLSIFMFDIDHFKKYNDRNGHPAGDEALKITGHLLNERKRETDTAARYGGEEFIVILPDTPKEGGYIFAESFRKIVESYPYPHSEGQPLGRVSISGGVSTFPEDGQSPTSLIEAADECLYRSKEHGRNHVTKRISKEAFAAQANAAPRGA